MVHWKETFAWEQLLHDLHDIQKIPAGNGPKKFLLMILTERSTSDTRDNTMLWDTRY